jgi:signal transduction histidine kinase
MHRNPPPAWPRCPKSHSLRNKLLIPIAGLMLLSLLGSTLAFVGGTALTQEQLVQQQITADAERVTASLAARVETATTAANLLANDPEVLRTVDADSAEALSTLNSRAVLVRNRFDVDLIQVYDHQGRARANLLISSLYRESSLLDLVEAGRPVVRAVEGQMLLLTRAEMPEGAGSVVAGLDLETELNRLVSRFRLASDLGLSLGEAQVGTRDDLPFDAPQGRGQGLYSQQVGLTLGQTPLDLLLVRSTTDIARVTSTGLQVMIGSALLTTVLLMGLGFFITRAIARPVQHLSATAEAVAHGDLTQRADLTWRGSWLGIGQDDEIGRLADAFNDMVGELQGLYSDLEAKVVARTQELSTAAEVAHAISISLNPDVVLYMAVELIHRSLGFDFAAALLIEPGSGMIVLHEAAGESAPALKERGLRLAAESGSLVGTAVATQVACGVQDVTEEPNYLEVPELRATRSEVAIPLIVGETVIGVLDVQSYRRYAFSGDVVQILTTLANQIATGVHHARLYEQVQRHAAELEERVAERTRELAEANERLKELDELKSKFVFDASHELRSPLTSIKGYGDLLVRGAVGTLSEEQRKFLEIMSGNTERLIALINDLLDVSRIEAGLGEQQFQPVDLNAVASQVVNAHKPQARAAGLTLITENGDHLPPVQGNHNQLVQVVTNLVANALNYTPAGMVRVRTRLDDGRDQLCLEVEDTGMGIPEEELPRIFERFYRSTGARDSGIQGTGLGLAIVQEIVTLHGGEIEVNSVVGQGSTFRIWLPVADGEDS